MAVASYEWTSKEGRRKLFSYACVHITSLFERYFVEALYSCCCFAGWKIGNCMFREEEDEKACRSFKL